MTKDLLINDIQLKKILSTVINKISILKFSKIKIISYEAKIYTFKHKRIKFLFKIHLKGICMS